MHDDLAKVAWRLVGDTADHPSEAELRRAVSSAYYAVFHAVCRLCADSLIGRNEESREWAAIYRSIDHGSFRAVRNQDPARRHLSASVHQLLELIIDLQSDRHDADYNPETFAYGRVEVRALITSAEVALNVLSNLPDQERVTFAVALIARPRRKQQ